jgi:hypothetical protein
MAGRAKRVGVVAIACLTALVPLVGCSDGDSDGSSTTAPARGFTPATDPGALQGPGTEIAEGVHVQPGSALVGSAFPVVDPDVHPDGDAPTPSGWQAVIAVQGDPIEVWDAYAAELGIAEDAGAEDACVVARPARPQDGRTAHLRFLTEPASDQELRLTCVAQFGDLSASLVHGAVGCIQPDVADDPCELRSGSALYLRRAPDGPRSSSGDRYLATDPLRSDRIHAGLDAEPEGAIVPPDLQGTGPSNLPGEGERIDDGIDAYLGTDGYDAPAAILPSGAESVIAPAVLIDCASGLVAVVRLPLDPAEAVRAFAAGDPHGASPVWTGKVGDQTWASRLFDAVGGYEMDLTAVGGSEPGSSYVLATECGD